MAYIYYTEIAPDKQINLDQLLAEIIAAGYPATLTFIKDLAVGVEYSTDIDTAARSAVNTIIFNHTPASYSSIENGSDWARITNNNTRVIRSACFVELDNILSDRVGAGPIDVRLRVRYKLSADKKIATFAVFKNDSQIEDSVVDVTTPIKHNTGTFSVASWCVAECAPGDILSLRCASPACSLTIVFTEIFIRRL